MLMPWVTRLEKLLRESREAFLEGLLRPSLPACVGMVLLVGTQIAVMCFIVTEESVSRVGSLVLITKETDYDADVTVNVLRLKHGDCQNPTVVCMGDSLMGECLDDPERMASELSPMVGPVDFRFLATDSQTLWEAVILLDQLPQNFQGVVVIPLSPIQVSHGVARLEQILASPRMPMYSSAFDAEVERAGLPVPSRTGVYFVDHSRFFVPRMSLMRKRLLGPVKMNRHALTEVTPEWTDDEWKKYEARIRDLVVSENMPSMFALLERLVERLKAREGVQVAVLDMPLHPRTAAIFGQAFMEYQSHLSAFAARTNTAVWRLTEEAKLGPNDFRDFGHVGHIDARKRFQTALCRRLANLLTDSEDLRRCGI
jgi:hypothetical protein